LSLILPSYWPSLSPSVSGWFDFVIVALTVISLYTPVDNASFMRLFRILRVHRLLRAWPSMVQLLVRLVCFLIDDRR
jgi:hypothetical protein